MTSKQNKKPYPGKRKKKIPDNSIPIKHEVIEDIFARGRLTRRELQIISIIIRDSWGFKSITNNGNWTKGPLKNEDFVKRTGISKGHISITLKNLRGHKIIFLKKDGKYSFNEHCAQWIDRKVTKRVTDKSYQKSNSKRAKPEQLSFNKSYQKSNSYQKGNSGVTKRVTLNAEDKQIERDTSSVKKKEIKKEVHRGRNPSSISKKTNPDIKKLIDIYFQKYKNKFGEKPMINGKRDGALAKTLLKSKSIEKLDNLLSQFFKSTWDFLQEKGSYSFSFFASTNTINRMQKELWDQKDKDQWGNPI